MDEKTKKLLQSLRGKKVGVFCDDSNLYHSYQKYGWRISIVKFKKLLEKYCDLRFFNYYIAIPREDDEAFKGTQDFLKGIERYVTVKKKQLKYIPIEKNVIKEDDKNFEKKGNVDVEICLDVAKTIDELDVVIIVSGDSDFGELKNYVVRDKKKNIIFVAYEENMAWELRQCWHIYLNRIQKEVILK